MEMYRKCDKCNVQVSSDLANCPLCGKYLLNDSKHEKVIENKYSFPKYEMKEIIRAKWVNIIRILFWLVGSICVLINLIWKTTPYYFPYVVTALVMIMSVFVVPFSKKRNYLKTITKSSVIIALFLIFIDAYDYYMFKTEFGWALCYTVPFLLSAVVLAAAIICLSSKRLEIDMMKNVTNQVFYSIIYFLIVFFAFKYLPVWPSFVYMCVSFVWFFILETIKHKTLWQELSRNFHI